MSIILLLAAAGLVALAWAAGAYLLLRMADTDAETAARVAAAQGRWTPPDRTKHRRQAAGNLLSGVRNAVSGLGSAAMQSGIVPGRTRLELQQTLQAAGFRGQNALALFVGSKIAAVVGLPLLTWVLVQRMELQGVMALAGPVVAGILGLVGPDMLIQRRRARYLKRLDNGLSDALDLMVICAQAGLSLDPAMMRVSVELRDVHPEVCHELEMTVRELEMMSDSAQALANLGRRTGLESLTRLTSTLIQTLQYGTPLTHSLRNLSNEMRIAALTRFEERAARLPVLLTLPMILFVLPCVFMIVGGPAAIQIGRSLGNN